MKRTLRLARQVPAALLALTLLGGCGTPQPLSMTQLEALGVREGMPHWEATPRLFRQGYACFVSGARREHFDCTKTAGVFPTCVLRVDFDVNDQNLILALRVSEPACLGTP